MISDPRTPWMPTGIGRSPRLRKVVLGSRAPRQLADWYRHALGLSDVDAETKAGDASLTAGGVELHITYQSHVAPEAAEPIRAVLNFVVDDIDEVEARLVATEAVWVRELERVPWGIIGTVLDPDGNYVQIVEPAREPLPWSREE
ncbi:MAG TPA: VOC family protein [Acidimicrobiia bacterium]|nr:VOC family protein [Acidimicrobiia bacterium]